MDYFHLTPRQRSHLGARCRRGQDLDLVELGAHLSDQLDVVRLRVGWKLELDPGLSLEGKVLYIGDHLAITNLGLTGLSELDAQIDDGDVRSCIGSNPQS